VPNPYGIVDWCVSKAKCVLRRSRLPRRNAVSGRYRLREIGDNLLFLPYDGAGLHARLGSAYASKPRCGCEGGLNGHCLEEEHQKDAQKPDHTLP